MVTLKQMLESMVNTLMEQKHKTSDDENEARAWETVANGNGEFEIQLRSASQWIDLEGLRHRYDIVEY